MISPVEVERSSDSGPPEISTWHFVYSWKDAEQHSLRDLKVFSLAELVLPPETKVWVHRLQAPSSTWGAGYLDLFLYIPEGEPW